MGFIPNIPGATTPGSLQNTVFPGLTSNNPIISQQLNRFKSELFTPLKVAGTLALEAMNRITRAPWIITCDSWLKYEEPEYIVLGVNPKRVHWSMPFRTSMVKTAAGTVTFTWRDPNRQNTIYDEPTLELTLQSSSILPVLSTAGQIKQNIVGSISRATPDFPLKNKVTDRINDRVTGGSYTQSDGMKNFYKFLRLYNIPRLNEETGEPNYIRLIMNTLMFPKLTIRGQFSSDEPLDWEETSESPTQIEWTSKFIVHNIVPNITIAEFADLLETWTQAGGDSGFRAPLPDDTEERYRNDVSGESFTSGKNYTDPNSTDEQKERKAGLEFEAVNIKANSMKNNTPQ